jgi:hypothetical protein
MSKTATSYLAGWLSLHPHIYYKGQSNIKLRSVKKIEALLCAAVGPEDHQRWLETCTACGRYGTVLQIDKAVKKLSARN